MKIQVAIPGRPSIVDCLEKSWNQFQDTVFEAAELLRERGWTPETFGVESPVGS